MSRRKGNVWIESLIFASFIPLFIICIGLVVLSEKATSSENSTTFVAQEKAKVFVLGAGGSNTVQRLEDDINFWFKENPKAEVVRITQSSGMYISLIIIWYKQKME